MSVNKLRASGELDNAIGNLDRAASRIACENPHPDTARELLIARELIERAKRREFGEPVNGSPLSIAS